MSRSRLTRWSAASVAAAALLVLAGCGGSSAGDAAAPATSDADRAACVDAANQFLTHWNTLPTTLPASPPARYANVTVPVPPGKKIAYLAQGYPADKTVSEAVAAAVAKVGWTSQTYIYDSTVPDLQAKFQTAIEAKPDYIGLSGFPAAAIQKQIDAAKEAGIGVILASVTDHPTGPTGLAATVNGTDTAQLIGRIHANKVLSDSGCNAKVALFTMDYPILKVTDDAFRTAISEKCPDCTVKITALQPQDLGTPRVAAQMVAQLESDPSIKYAYTEIGNIANGLAQAVKTAGLEDVRIFGEVPDEASYAALRNRTNAWWVDQSSLTQGYEITDAAIRIATTGQPQADIGGYPLALLTPENVPGGTGIPTIPTNLLDLYAATWRPSS
ncbi:substrate-binding domain-containing protein [Pseudonocardia kujensis]|uniref:substrate-binding domain-containing protein n=1 Tax=Pseudonocardia kujensis TaxID=1128675 RepID=UPI001E41B323|nr:substrate-binding domain-containing protein [Pseudonocardia kujensis]MCE0763531.1 substrate-binding domain-containing protein [Pseudonocardia kujensis]